METTVTHDKRMYTTDQRRASLGPRNTCAAMISLRFLCFLLCLMPSSLWAATWYVSGTGAGAMNGKSYTNAYAGWADITMANINAGDTLIVCGVVSHTSVMAFTRAGKAGNPITITGVCPEEGGQTGVLDGLNTASPNVLQLSTSGYDASYVTVQHLTIRNSGQGADDNCVLVSSLGGGPGINVFSHVTVTHCGGGNGIIFQKGSPTVQDSTIYDIGGDAVGWSAAGTNPQILRNTIYDFSKLNMRGDGIACDETMASGGLIQNNTIRFTILSSTKQAIICGNNGTGTVIIEGNTIIAPVATTTNHGISFVSGAGIIRKNTITGFRGCVTTFTGAITTLDIDANLCTNSVYVVILSSDAGTPTYRIRNNTGMNVTNGLRAISMVASNLTHLNNLYSLTTGSTGDVLYIGTNHAYTGNNNLFYPEGATFIENYVCGGSTYNTLVAYTVACAQDAQSLASNPLLASTGEPNVGSPTRRAGVLWQGCLDALGRLCGHPPDIGAYQMGLPPANITPPAAPRGLNVTEGPLTWMTVSYRRTNP